MHVTPNPPSPIPLSHPTYGTEAPLKGRCLRKGMITPIQKRYSPPLCTWVQSHVQEQDSTPKAPSNTSNQMNAQSCKQCPTI